MPAVFDRSFDLPESLVYVLPSRVAMNRKNCMLRPILRARFEVQSMHSA